MASLQIELERSQSGCDIEGMQQLQHELKEKCADRQKMRQIFDTLDTDCDGRLNICELKDHIRDFQCRNLSGCLANNILQMPDEDSDGVLNFEEFYKLSLRKEWSFIRVLFNYCKMIVPPPNRECDEIDPSKATACERNRRVCPCLPPLTMITFSIIQIIVFSVDYAFYVRSPNINVKQHDNATLGPAATQLIYNPIRRYEAWRFVSYMFVHVGAMHIFMNLIIQIFLGVALELVHHWWRVGLVYLAGVLAGSIVTSIVNPGIYLAGASGGVYALITAHIATIIMNWKETNHTIVQLFAFLVYCGIIVGFAIYQYLHLDKNCHVMYLCGAIAGLLVGVGILQKLNIQQWERKLRWCAIILYFLLMISGISIHVFYKSRFP